MANPFYSNQNNARPTSNINDIYKMIMNSNNPMQMFNYIANNNPRLAPAAQLLNNGYSPQKVFEAMCQQRGINPQEFLNQLNGNNTQNSR